MCLKQERDEEEEKQALPAETSGQLENPNQGVFMEVSHSASTAMTAGDPFSVADSSDTLGYPAELAMPVMTPQSIEGSADMESAEATATEGKPVQTRKRQHNRNGPPKHRRGKNDPEPDWSATIRDKQHNSGTSRSRHACDRCRMKKTRCDISLNHRECLNCMQDGLACLVTDPVTNETFERGAAGRLMARVTELERQLKVRRLSFDSRVNFLEHELQTLQTQASLYRSEISSLSNENALLRYNNTRMSQEIRFLRSYGRSDGFSRASFQSVGMSPGFIDPQHTQMAHANEPFTPTRQPGLRSPNEQNIAQETQSPHAS